MSLELLQLFYAYSEQKRRFEALTQAHAFPDFWTWLIGEAR